jgi:hypothetical protein
MCGWSTPGRAKPRAKRAYFNKLKEAYVKSRYSDHYTISEEQLLWIGNCVEELGRAVNAMPRTALPN